MTTVTCAPQEKPVLWANGALTYWVDASLAADKSKIEAAIAVWMSPITCLTFTECTESAVADCTPTVLRFTSTDEECRANFGLDPAEGTVVSVSSTCEGRLLAQKIGLALGFAHTHNRADRGDYVAVNAANLAAGKAELFNVAPADRAMLGPYDYDSLMHLNGTAYAADLAQPVITAPQVFGTGEVLSTGDIAAVAFLYGEVSSSQCAGSTYAAPRCAVSRVTGLAEVGQAWVVTVTAKYDRDVKMTVTTLADSGLYAVTPDIQNALTPGADAGVTATLTITPDASVTGMDLSFVVKVEDMADSAKFVTCPAVTVGVAGDGERVCYGVAGAGVCSGKGACEAAGVCSCNPGWTGAACQEEAEVEFVPAKPAAVPMAQADHVFNALEYRRGTANSAEGIEFTVRVAEGEWFALGFRAIELATANMAGLQIVAGDAGGVHDYDAGAANGAPTRRATRLTKLISERVVDGAREFVLYRPLVDAAVTTGRGAAALAAVTIPNGTPVNFATARGTGGPNSPSWRKHIQQRQVLTTFAGAAFEMKCPYSAFPANGHAFSEFGYREGLVGRVAALEFTVRVPVGTKWVGIGVQAGGAYEFIGIDVEASALTDAAPRPARLVSVAQDGSQVMEVVFYRFFEDGAAAIGSGEVSVGTAAAAAVPAAPPAAPDKDFAWTFTPCSAMEEFRSRFVAKCSAESFPVGHVFSAPIEKLSYKEGVVGDAKALEVSILLEKGAAATWWAVGFRGGYQDGTGGLDIYAGDTDSMTAVAYTEGGGSRAAPGAAIGGTSSYVTITFTRLFNPGNAHPIEEDEGFDVWTARGDGPLPTTGLAAAARRTASVGVILDGCAALGSGGGKDWEDWEIALLTVGCVLLLACLLAGAWLMSKRGKGAAVDTEAGNLLDLGSAPETDAGRADGAGGYSPPRVVAFSHPPPSQPRPGRVLTPADPQDGDVRQVEPSPPRVHTHGFKQNYAAAPASPVMLTSGGSPPPVAQGVPVYPSGGGPSNYAAPPRSASPRPEDAVYMAQQPPATLAPPTFSASPRPPSSAYPSAAALELMGLTNGNPLSLSPPGFAPIEPGVEAEDSYGYTGCSRAAEQREARQLRPWRLEKKVLKRYKRSGFAVVSGGGRVDAGEVRAVQERTRRALDHDADGVLTDADVALLARYRESLSSPFHTQLREAKDASLPLYRSLRCGADLFEAHVRLPTSHVLIWPAPTILTPTAPLPSAVPDAARIIEFEIIRGRVFEAPDGTLVLPSFSAMVVLSTLLLSPNKCVVRVAHRERAAP